MILGIDQTKDFSSIDEPVFEQFADELDVFFPACSKLAEREVVLCRSCSTFIARW